MSKAGGSLRVLGVMTGTSCDGLDAACIEISAEGWRPLWADSLPYPKALRENVLAIQLPGARLSIRELLNLNARLGEWYGSSVSKLLKRYRPSPDVIANHGQTVAHFPDVRPATTLQLGDPARISQATGITVVSNFRDGDIAAGGKGAPLVPLFHSLLAQGLPGGTSGVAIHNIGGISNLTYVSPNGEILAFDTGPGNIWIDAAAAKATRGKSLMDRNGALAARGKIDTAAVRAVLKHPYFSRPAPKATGRDDFPFSWFAARTRAKGADLVATATAVTVESIARAYEGIRSRGRPLDAVYLCGGGARNPVLVEWLSGRMEGIRFGDLSEHGLDPRWIEAQAFAVYGFVALQGAPLGGPWTGAKGFGPPAHVIPGENWSQVLSAVRG